MSERQPPQYEVGFARPPRQTQFRKGTSGNPKGRPRGSKSLSTLLTETLDEKVVVRENGRCGRITKRAAMIKQQSNKAVSGDQRAVRYLIDLDLRLNPEGARHEISIESLRQVFEREQEKKPQMAADHVGGPEFEKVSEPFRNSSLSEVKARLRKC